MALNGTALWNARKAAMAVAIDGHEQSSDPVSAQALREAAGIADSTAIVDYFKTNTLVTTTTGAPNSEHTGNIS